MRRSLYFTGARQVEVREEEVPPPGRNEVLVRSRVSAISAGTEMLFYRSQLEEGTRLDTSIRSLAGPLVHPFKYGYGTVGEIVALGEGVPCDWNGKLVFSFHCHESRFTVPLSEIIAVPPGITEDDALFLPSMETALSLVMDGAPLVGEDVVVLGQGTIGLLTTFVLSRMPTSSLTTADRYPLRRERSLEMGADTSLDPSLSPSQLLERSRLYPGKADLTFELSGEPKALEYATHLTGMEGRVIVGSWYGNKEATLCLGEDFHRNRLRIRSSQVSRIDGSLSARWSKDRRLGVAWRMIRQGRPSRLITHRFDVSDAPQAYRLLDEHGDEAIQVVLHYPEG